MSPPDAAKVQRVYQAACALVALDDAHAKAQTHGLPRNVDPLPCAPPRSKLTDARRALREAVHS